MIWLNHNNGTTLFFSFFFWLKEIVNEILSNSFAIHDRYLGNNLRRTGSYAWSVREKLTVSDSLQGRPVQYTVRTVKAHPEQCSYLSTEIYGLNRKLNVRALMPFDLFRKDNLGSVRVSLGLVLTLTPEKTVILYAQILRMSVSRKAKIIQPPLISVKGSITH